MRLLLLRYKTVNNVFALTSMLDKSFPAKSKTSKLMTIYVDTCEIITTKFYTIQ